MKLTVTFGEIRNITLETDVPLELVQRLLARIQPSPNGPAPDAHVHHWLCESPSGSIIRAACKTCPETTEFPASPGVNLSPTHSPERRRPGRPPKVQP